MGDIPVIPTVRIVARLGELLGVNAHRHSAGRVVGGKALMKSGRTLERKGC
jgi:hypothetical protein